MAKYSFDCEESLVEDITKLMGRTPKSEIYREALRVLQKLLTDGTYTTCLLPHPRKFERRLRELKPSDISAIKTELNRLTAIAEWVDNSNLTEAKKRKELLK